MTQNSDFGNLPGPHHVLAVVDNLEFRMRGYHQYFRIGVGLHEGADMPGSTILLLILGGCIPPPPPPVGGSSVTGQLIWTDPAGVRHVVNITCSTIPTVAYGYAGGGANLSIPVHGAPVSVQLGTATLSAQTVQQVDTIWGVLDEAQFVACKDFSLAKFVLRHSSVLQCHEHGTSRLCD